MISKRFLPALLIAVFVPVAHAATIEEVISPTSVVLAQGTARTIAKIDGKAVFYCGLSAFGSWAAHLIGQPVGSNPESGITVAVDERDVALAGLLVSKGWLQPPMLDDEAQAAITERRGGWACASAVTPFELMHSSVDPKVLAGIALNESGLNGHAWPWTLNIAGQGYFFKSREDAYRVVQSLIARGGSDFDVGIMQINWLHWRRPATSPPNPCPPSSASL